MSGVITLLPMCLHGVHKKTFTFTLNTGYRKCPGVGIPIGGRKTIYIFLILSFCRVLYVMRFLLGVSPASEC